MQPASFIAIDPGNSGAHVIRHPDGRVVDVGAYKSEKTVAWLMSVLHQMNHTPGGMVAVIERVWASPVMGVSAAFAFGENYGGWCMALRVAGLPVYCVTPQAWQKVVAPQVTGQGGERKQALKRLAVERFPGVKVTLANCDALLISDYVLAQLRAGKALGEEL